MATLQIEFNCLCLFVRDETNHVVHVLMPSTLEHVGDAVDSGRSHDEYGHMHEPHYVRLYHSKTGNEGIPLEGWSLVLGGERGSADTGSLDRTQPGEVIDLTAVTGNRDGQYGRKVKQGLVTGANPAVAARVTLRAGRAVHAPKEVAWNIKCRDFDMAYQVVWQIDDFDGTLAWEPANARKVPLDSLAGLDSDEPLYGEEKRGYRLQVFHTTEDGLPPHHENGQLEPDLVKEHFRIYYETLLDIPHPNECELPQPPVEIGKVHCGTAQVLLE